MHICSLEHNSSGPQTLKTTYPTIFASRNFLITQQNALVSVTATGNPFSYMGIARSTLSRNNHNLALPLYCSDYPIVLLNNIYSPLYMYINLSAWIIFICNYICYTKHLG